MSDEQIKMADVFELPLQRGCLIGFKSGTNLFNDDGVTPQDMATEAINNHDRLTAENEALREDIALHQEIEAKHLDEIQALKAEVERLRLYEAKWICSGLPDINADLTGALNDNGHRLVGSNDDVKHFSEQFRNLEQERDQLKAALQLLAGAAHGVMDAEDMEDEEDISTMYSNLNDALLATPEQCLAAHDADVIELAINECANKTLDGYVIYAEALQHYANQFRQQAQEVQS